MFWLFFLSHVVLATIDLNQAELEYLADHLLPEECRKLVAAAHFKSYYLPNALDQAEQAIPRDESCLDLLLHWNSAKGEGRGETHEVLEHRLRQMGKTELADWLGKTVFHQLGEDLEQSLHDGLKDLATDEPTTRNISMPTLSPKIEPTDPTKWLPIDSILLTVLVGIFGIMIIMCFYMIIAACCRKCKTIKIRKKRNKSKMEYFEMLETSGSESEDKFDIRDHEM